MEVGLVLLSGSCWAQVISKWPILYPSPSATSTLVLEKSSGNLFHAQGAFEKFHCWESGEENVPFAKRECASPLVLVSANPVFHLSLSAIDLHGRFTLLDTPPVIHVNASLAKLETERMTAAFQTHDDSYSPATVEFSVELHNESIPVQVSVSLGAVNRQLVLFYDPTPPEAKPQQKQNITASPDGRFMTVILFRDWIYLSVGTGCDPRLGSSLPERLDDDGHGLNLLGAPMFAPHISATIEASRVCARTLAEERKLNPVQCVALGSNINPESLRCQISMMRRAIMVSGKLHKPMMRHRRAREVEKAMPAGEAIEVRVLKSSLMDGAGNQLRENVTYTGRVFRRKKAMGQDCMGTVSSKTLMAASAVVAASSVAPSSSFSLAVEGPSGLASLVDLLSLGQKFYLIGFLADGKLPLNFRRIAEAFSWCALNIKLLWESQDSTTLEDEMVEEDTEQQTKLELLGKGVAAVEAIEMFKFSDGANGTNKIDPYIALGRILFIACALHVAVLLMRSLIFLVINKFDFNTPSFLVFPRIELFIAFWTLPAISAACAKLMSHSTSGLFVGFLLLLLMPGMFLCLLAVVLYSAFFQSDPDEWRVQMIASSVQTETKPLSRSADTILALPPCGPITTEIKTHQTEPIKSKGLKGMDSILEKTIPGPFSQIWTRHRQRPSKQTPVALLSHQLKSWSIQICHVLFGRPVEKAKWISRHADDKFLQRFGPLFEDYRVHWHSSRAESKASSKTRSLRHKISAAEGIPLATALLDCTKRMLLAMICVTEIEASGLGQLMGASLIVAIFLVYLRVFHPYRSRWRLALAMVVELADCLTFIVGIVAVAAPNRNNQNIQTLCGLIMICTQAVAYFLMLCEKVIPPFHRGFSLLFTFYTRSVKA